MLRYNKSTTRTVILDVDKAHYAFAVDLVANRRRPNQCRLEATDISAFAGYRDRFGTIVSRRLRSTGSPIRWP
jgi:hypothetical protein